MLSTPSKVFWLLFCSFILIGGEYYLFSQAPKFEDVTNPKDYWYATLGGFIGAAIGVAWAWCDSQARLKNERANLKTHLLAAFNRNLWLLKKCSDNIAANKMEDFRMDATSVSHILFSGRDLFPDSQWAADFSGQLYQIEHINAQIDFAREWIIAGSPALGAGATNPLAVLHSHCIQVHKDISALLSRYESCDATQ